MKKSYKLQRDKQATRDAQTTTPSTFAGNNSSGFEGTTSSLKPKKAKPVSDSSGTPSARKSRRLTSGKPAPTPPVTDTSNSKKSSNEKGIHHRQYTFSLRHGSLLFMRGNMQRDWDHSVPKRVKAAGLRISLTFRKVCQ
eukprot:TRINITY_DN7076_c0_g1_i2.p1 TRINITY_DN7076_c0_g1~~TRINITY_DN7076_c0_g1_i2.p1  ORF type:complete len:139 (-),score=6.89 TRINITY_DN7076_c0_g1_i2:253-669(-)